MDEIGALARGLSGAAGLVVVGTVVVLLAGAFSLGYVSGRSSDQAKALQAARDPGSSALGVSKQWPSGARTESPGGENTGGAPGTRPAEKTGAGQGKTPDGSPLGGPGAGSGAGSGSWRVRVEIYDQANGRLAEHWRKTLAEASFPDAVVLSVAESKTGAMALRLYVGRAADKQDLAKLLGRIKQFEDPDNGGRAFANAGIEYVVVEERRPAPDAVSGES